MECRAETINTNRRAGQNPLQKEHETFKAVGSQKGSRKLVAEIVAHEVSALHSSASHIRTPVTGPDENVTFLVSSCKVQVCPKRNVGVWGPCRPCPSLSPCSPCGRSAWLQLLVSLSRQCKSRGGLAHGSVNPTYPTALTYPSHVNHDTNARLSQAKRCGNLDSHRDC